MRCIDADALIEDIDGDLTDSIAEGRAIEKIMNAPTIEERKKGRWIPHSEKSREYIGTVLVNVTYDYWLCDACGYRVENGQPMYNFCPYCGADMRGERHG